LRRRIKGRWICIFWVRGMPERHRTALRLVFVTGTSRLTNPSKTFKFRCRRKFYRSLASSRLNLKPRVSSRVALNSFFLRVTVTDFVCWGKSRITRICSNSRSTFKAWLSNISTVIVIAVYLEPKGKGKCGVVMTLCYWCREPSLDQARTIPYMT
jgi:hypothetical protein